MSPLLGRRVARFNRTVTNRVGRPIASRIPGFGVVRHIGRSTGRVYRTPVNVFAHGDGFVIALTYGSDTDWVRNILAADGCELVTRGRRAAVRSPRVVRDERVRLVPPAVRPMLRLLGVTEFLMLARTGPGTTTSRPAPSR